MLRVARLELRAIATIAFFLFSITLGERIAQGAQTGTMTAPSARAIPVRPYSLQEARFKSRFGSSERSSTTGWHASFLRGRLLHYVRAQQSR